MRRKQPRSGFSERKARYAGPPPDRASNTRKSLSPPMKLPDGTVRYVLRLGPKGRALLPADMRAAMALGDGEILLAWLKDGELRMESHARALRRMQHEAQGREAQAVLASDELIADRRAENAKAEEASERWRHQMQKGKR
jgi:hypothetical protein